MSVKQETFILSFFTAREKKIQKMLIYHYSENLQEAGHIK